MRALRRRCPDYWWRLERLYLTAFERSVFGITPDDLEPCDLPAADEVVGELFPDTTLDQRRLLVRPDLWEDDGTGKAVRRSGR